jgi:hypothetical protein
LTAQENHHGTTIKAVAFNGISQTFRRKEDINEKRIQIPPHRDEECDFTQQSLEENPPSSTICRVVRLKPGIARKRILKAKGREVSPVEERWTQKIEKEVSNVSKPLVMLETPQKQNKQNLTSQL